ncbi:MAG TPA: phage virion morphogenesis protein [Gemmatimonadales bacterium]|nr:phage virion morphogenesis protein [Gemmatimonadales bacterium]
MAEPWVTVSLGPTLSLLQRIREKAANLEPVLNGPIANAVHSFFEKRFATEGEYGGQKWAPLAEQTLRWRAQNHRTGMPVLQFSRELWSSLVKRSSPLGYRIADKDSLLMGTSVQRAEKHQLGTEHMPACEIVPDVMPEADTQAWARLIVDYVEEAA